ncbi:MAG: lysylphosphatidylglycerol synthase transmembrane domain-containing protein [Gemmatimonadota bacterium]|nr:lysylphosphatidylglycerol synthase transmembrane domain-containing protein [Gemmatimonadota bacterium]
MKRFFNIAIKALVTLGLLYYVFSRFGIDTIGSQLLSVDYRFLLLGVAIFVFSNFLGAFQWQLLLQGQGIAFPYRRAANLYFIGLFFNSILPSCLGGDVVKVYSISRIERKGREGLAATFVDRFAGFFLLALLAIGASVFLFADPLVAKQALTKDIIISICAIFTIFLLSVVIIFSRRVGRFIYEVLLGGVNPFGLRDRFRDLHSYLHIYREKHLLAVQIFFLSLAIQVARIAVHYFCARAIGFNIDFLFFQLLVPLIAMAAILPISFGGLGVRETTGSVLFAPVAAAASMDVSLAVTTQLLASLVGILVGLAGGALFILDRKTPQDG